MMLLLAICLFNYHFQFALYFKTKKRIIIFFYLVDARLIAIIDGNVHGIISIISTISPVSLHHAIKGDVIFNFDYLCPDLFSVSYWLIRWPSSFEFILLSTTQNLRLYPICIADFRASTMAFSQV